MKAVVVEKFGESVQVKDQPLPEPKDHEVQIHIAYSGVNPVDWKIQEGYFKERMPHEFPIILGWDAAGVVAQTGYGVHHFKKGDEVYAYCREPVIKKGTFAEYVSVNENFLALKPKNISFAEAASIPLAGLTAWQSLFDYAKLQKGQTVLIHAGAGGVGSFAIQLAKIKGAIVYTTASVNNHPYVKKLGADFALDYHQEDFVRAFKMKLPDGFDVVFDCVGGETFRKSFALVKKGGCLVSICNFNAESLGQQYGVRSGHVFVSPNGRQLREISALIESGQLKPPHIEEFTLAHAKQALEKIRTGHTQGKIVLKVS